MLPVKSSTISLLAILLISHGLCAPEDNPEKREKSDRSDLKKSLSKDCATSYSFTCLKLDIIAWVEKLDENDNLSVFPGVSVVKENISDSARTGDIVAELAREFPNDPEARLDAYMMKKITGYLNSHAVKLNLWNAVKEEARRSGGGLGGGGGGGGGGGKHRGGMEYLLAAGAMMKGTLMAVAMGGVAAIAGKALMTAMISLMLSAIIGLKALSSGGGKSTTYEIVAKPVYSHSSSHSVSHEDHGGHYGHSGYGRSYETASLPLGLQPEYKPAS